jgi:hypothetical protein
MEEPMKIVHADQVEWKRAQQYRAGTFHSRRIVEGPPGTIDNYFVSMGRSDADFDSPRHRHNFDQFRIQLDGTFDFARDGKMVPGSVAYFPEGTFYGPQTSEGIATNLVVQFGSSGGGGFLSRAEVNQGMEELKQFGTFEAGIFRRNPGVSGKSNLDAVQAIWEYLHGRPMEYPKPRYDKPVIMDPESFSWVPLNGKPGLSEKFMGVFSERKASLALYKLEPGATMECEGRAIYFGYRGTATAEGEHIRVHTTLILEWNERTAIVGGEDAEIMRIGLPDLRDMQPLVRKQAKAG